MLKRPKEEDNAPRCKGRQLSSPNHKQSAPIRLKFFPDPKCGDWPGPKQRSQTFYQEFLCFLSPIRNIPIKIYNFDRQVQYCLYLKSICKLKLLQNVNVCLLCCVPHHDSSQCSNICKTLGQQK